MMPISKDEDLHSGLLQLPAGTTIVLSDALVSEGTVTQRRIPLLLAKYRAQASSQAEWKMLMH